MQSPPFPRYLVPPRSKYSPQHHVLFSNSLSFLFSLNISEQVSRPYKTTGKIFKSLNFWIVTWKTKDFEPNDSKHFLISSCSLISPAIEFWFVKVVPKYLNSFEISSILKFGENPCGGSRVVTYGRKNRQTEKRNKYLFFAVSRTLLKLAVHLDALVCMIVAILLLL